ncbi:MAG: low temperature requirement protein A [Anaerolineae bacterium]|nr:low temperature requirement protein A [Anaerolineae bacterium]
MNILRLQLPRPPQSVGWLELFYDLVYVATVIALGNWLGHHITPGGVATFALLFTSIWGSWVGTVLYFNRFDSNDVGQRVLVFVQMYFIIMLAMHIGDPLEKLSRGYALSYACLVLVLAALYGRAWHIFPTDRALIQDYILTNLLMAGIWFLSAFVSPPGRYWLWVAGFGLGLAAPLTPFMRRHVAGFRTNMHHLSERLGLLTIIVLGGSLIQVITAGTVEESTSPWLLGVAAMVIVASMWWVYFDHASTSAPRGSDAGRYTWFVMHLPLIIGITAFGVAAKKLVWLDPGHDLTNATRWLFTGSLAVCLLALALLELLTKDRAHPHRHVLANGRIVGAIVLLIFGWQGDSLGMDAIVVISTGAVAAQVVFDVMYRIGAELTGGGDA